MNKKLVAGNWKMNGLGASEVEIDAIVKGIAGVPADVAICPPATLVARFADRVKGSALGIGGQDCHAKVSGAHTGDISAAMLKDAGATYVIVGHSERRRDHGEDDATVAAKTSAAWEARLCAIVCVGETLDERKAGSTLEIVGAQLAGSVPDGATAANTVIAYEPVWAIGTGLTPTSEQIADVHSFIRRTLVARFGAQGEAIRILYGGSVAPGNAQEIFAIPDVDGGLVGGASLTADKFLGVVAGVGGGAR